MNEIFLFAAFTWGIVGTGLAIWLGFKMGRLTKGESPLLKQKEVKSVDKNAIDNPDIFTEAVNDGLEGDPNERLRTI